MAYGRIGKGEYGWLSQAAPGFEIYSSGWPTAESNVVGCWLVDEASGNIVDEVSGITLAATGTPTYSVAATGSFVNLSPGITYANGAFHKKGSSEATLNAGTGSVTVEIWFKTTSSSNLMGMFATQTTATTGIGYTVYMSGGANTFRCDMCDGAGTAVNATFAYTGGTWDDGNIHKLRVVWNRAGSVTCYCDGVTQGTPASLATLAGKTINTADVKIGTDPADSVEFAGTIYEVRVSLNATNNSGGPGGG